MAERIVPDAHAVLSFLGEKPGWADVEEVLRTGEPWMTGREADFVNPPANGMIDETWWGMAQ